jgi:hypothetical protein
MDQKIGLIFQRVDAYEILLGGVVGRPETSWIRRGTLDTRPVATTTFFRRDLILFLTAIGMMS